MVRVAPVKLQVGPKVLWFDPTDLDIHSGDHVIVSTERGHEYGTATSDIIDVSDEMIENLKSPLKPVVRLATPEDDELLVDLERQGDEALAIFRELVEESNIDMHPVLVEYLFDGDKAIFYFESEERVDFRDLVRKLASQFHVRVDMRQIGVRDAARMVGGLGHCGQELCCRRMGGDFNPVSIRMAKEQNLSLNPQKISGVCGRLMCCLRYEFETYKEFNSRAPKLNAKVDVPGGVAEVTEVNVPNETIALRLEDGKTIHVALTDFEEPEEGRRPHVISEETFARYTEENAVDKLSTALFETSAFTSEEKLADPRSRRRTPAKAAVAEEEAAPAPRERRGATRKPRRRTRGAQAEGEAAPVATEEQAAKPSRRSKAADAKPKKDAKAEQPKKAAKPARSKKDAKPAADAAAEAPSRRRRRRRSGGSAATEGQAAAPAVPESKDAKQRSVRPGHKSSGLRAAQSDAKPAPAKKAAEGSSNEEGAKRSGARRRPRRRRNSTQGDSNAAE